MRNAPQLLRRIAVVAVQPVWRGRELRALREPALTLAPIVAELVLDRA